MNLRLKNPKSHESDNGGLSLGFEQFYPRIFIRDLMSIRNTEVWVKAKSTDFTSDSAFIHTC